MRVKAGLEANFLIPNDKLDVKYHSVMLRGSETLGNIIEAFLSGHFSAYQVVATNIKGFWRGSFDGIYTQFKVAFVGKDRLNDLEGFLEAVAIAIGHECIYLKTGEDVWFVYPEEEKQYQL
ncbi:MAG: hypothetical protein WD898_01430 [Candidatus Paceibacterota bacterium]